MDNPGEKSHAQRARQELPALGNPIGGIIVKGGKNPGGSMMTITTNGNGELNLNGSVQPELIGLRYGALGAVPI